MTNEVEREWLIDGVPPLLLLPLHVDVVAVLELLLLLMEGDGLLCVEIFSPKLCCLLVLVSTGEILCDECGTQPKMYVGGGILVEESLFFVVAFVLEVC